MAGMTPDNGWLAFVLLARAAARSQWSFAMGRFAARSQWSCPALAVYGLERL